MSEELKKCPFCGGDAKLDDHVFAHCDNSGCGAAQWLFHVKTWNTRPIESALQQRIGELEAQLKNIVDACNAGDFDKVYDEYKHAETLLRGVKPA